MKRYLFFIFLLFFVGCGGNIYQETLIVPDSHKNGVKSFYVVKNLSDNIEFDKLIQRSMSRQGYELKQDEKTSDISVTYDISYIDYGLMTLFFRDTKDGYPMVIGHNLRTGNKLINRELMVDEIIEKMAVRLR